MIGHVDKPPHIAVAVCVVVLCCALFYPALQNGFVWDDVNFLVRSSAYSGVDRLTKSLFEPFALFNAYYRPLVAFSFALIPASLDFAASAHHGINLSIHIANVFLVYLCAQRAGVRLAGATTKAGAIAAVVAAIVFAVHPLVLEPLLWISGRFDLAMTLFCLLFVCVELGPLEGGAKTLLLSALYFGAASSKESAVSFPIAIVLLHTLLWTSSPRTNNWWLFMWVRRDAYVGVLIGGFVYLSLRYFAMANFGSGNFPFGSVDSVSDHLVLAGTSLYEYVRLLIFPWTSTAPWHPFDISAVGESARIGVSLGFVFVVAALGIAAFPLRRAWAFPGLIFVAMLLPVLHLVSFSTAGNLISDRYALAPLAMLLVATAPLCAKRFEGSSVSMSLTVMLCLVAVLVIASWVVLARVTTLLWRDDIALWSYAYSRAPQAEMVASNYAASLIKLGKLEEAETVATKIRESGKATMGPMVNLAMIKAARGDIDAAYSVLQSIELRNTNAGQSEDFGTYYCTFAQLDVMRNDWSAALANSNLALRYAPESVTCRMVKARALFGVGSKLEALALLASLKQNVEPKIKLEIEQLTKLWSDSK